MKKIIEHIDGFRWVDGDTSSMPFLEGSDQYNELVKEGCKIELMPQSQKEAHHIESSNELIKKQLLSLDVPSYTLERALTGDLEAIRKVKKAESEKAILRAKIK